MSSMHYSKELKIRVAKEAMLKENHGLEHIIAEKYGIQPFTVKRWRDQYCEFGEVAFKKGVKPQKSERERQLEKENEELRLEVEILKKAAAFLANVKRD
ncbi:MAG: transposase [Firmicutes bacterium]|nr:transposase [Bacillota bacterium]